MKACLLILVLLLPCLSHGQGTFFFDNITAPTHVGSSNGALAGRGIWGQMLVGQTTDSLVPVGIAVEHRTNGFVSGGILTVPGIDGGNLAYVQLVAWDGLRWGTSINDVPSNQLGRTDVISIFLTYDFQPAFTPPFAQSAIVPIPEPSAFALAALGAGLLWCATRARRRKFR